MSGRHYPTMSNNDSPAMEHAIPVHSNHPRPCCRLAWLPAHHPALCPFLPHRIKEIPLRSIRFNFVICLSIGIFYIPFQAVAIKHQRIRMVLQKKSFVTPKQTIFDGGVLKINERFDSNDRSLL